MLRHAGYVDMIYSMCHSCQSHSGKCCSGSHLHMLSKLLSMRTYALHICIHLAEVKTRYSLCCAVAAAHDMERFLRRIMSKNSNDIDDILRNIEFPAEWPFTPTDFSRADESDDANFYIQPRVGIFHIDAPAVRALTKFYETRLPPNAEILDLCSSWVSHLPEGYKPGGLTVLGMSQAELDANVMATRRIVQDLNENPKLAFADNSFDVVTNVVSVDYLTRPLQVFQEMGRVLKPGGRAIMSFSNRCFPTKAINMWCASSDMDHVYIVACYFHYSRVFSAPSAVDLQPSVFGMSDPMFVVEATAL